MLISDRPFPFFPASRISMVCVLCLHSVKSPCSLNFAVVRDPCDVFPFHLFALTHIPFQRVRKYMYMSMYHISMNILQSNLACLVARPPPKRVLVDFNLTL